MFESDVSKVDGAERSHTHCVARDKISHSQFLQLMDEDNDNEKTPSVRLSSLSVSEVESVLGPRSAYDNQGMGSFPDVPLPELLSEYRELGIILERSC